MESVWYRSFPPEEEAEGRLGFPDFREAEGCPLCPARLTAADEEGTLETAEESALPEFTPEDVPEPPGGLLPEAAETRSGFSVKEESITAR